MVRLYEVREMDMEIERGHAEAEAVRQKHELARQAAEQARHVAEASRAAAEDARRLLADEVSETVETLTTILHRMEAVEALRRDAYKERGAQRRADEFDRRLLR